MTTQNARSTVSAPDRPAYSFSEAARYVRVPSATLRTWVVGREVTSSAGRRHHTGLIRPADPRHRVLSFNNLIEAHVLRSLRTSHGVAFPEIRKAIAYAEQSLLIERLLLSSELQSSAGELFLERYGQLINLSKSGQLAMRSLLESHLQRVEWDTNSVPHRLFPFARSETLPDARPIVIDPSIGFGRPILVRAGISTRVIVDRIDAGEAPESVADDYGLSVTDVREAVVYEQAA